MADQRSEWRRVHADKGGHRLFEHSSDGVHVDNAHTPGGIVPRLFVADGSGGNPDTTDDGRLEVDPSLSELVLTAPYGHFGCSVPVLRAGRERT